MAHTTKIGILAEKKYEREREDYNEGDDAFLKHFDEEGNFMENIDNEKEEDGEKVKITYYYKKDNETE